MLESVTSATRPTSGTISAGPAQDADRRGLPLRFTMSELVQRTGAPAATIRYYLSVGLLPPPVKVASNRYLYDERHVELVRIVRLLRERRGLSLEAIGRVLPEMLPDLLGRPSGVFRAEMWGDVLSPGAAGASTRERIVEIGAELFSRRGYAEVTVDDVCRAADMAKGSFYRQFTSKEELFLAVAGAVTRELSRTLGDLAARGPQEVERVVEALATAMMPRLAVVLDLTSLAAQRRPGYAAALSALVSALGEALRPVLGGAGGEADEVVARAVFEAVRRVVDTVGIDTAPSLTPLAGSARMTHE